MDFIQVVANGFNFCHKLLSLSHISHFRVFLLRELWIKKIRKGYIVIGLAILKINVFIH